MRTGLARGFRRLSPLSPFFSSHLFFWGPVICFWRRGVELTAKYISTRLGSNSPTLYLDSLFLYELWENFGIFESSRLALIFVLFWGRAALGARHIFVDFSALIFELRTFGEGAGGCVLADSNSNFWNFSKFGRILKNSVVPLIISACVFPALSTFPVSSCRPYLLARFVHTLSQFSLFLSLLYLHSP